MIADNQFTQNNNYKVTDEEINEILNHNKKDTPNKDFSKNII